MSDKFWVDGHFEEIEYHSLDQLETACRRARQAEAAGTWKDFQVENVNIDPYSDRKYAYLVGKRPETESEQARRLAAEADMHKRREQYEREQYERLKTKFEKENKA